MEFNLRKFLLEKKLTSNSRLLSELEVRAYANKILVIEPGSRGLASERFYIKGTMNEALEYVVYERNNNLIDDFLGDPEYWQEDIQELKENITVVSKDKSLGLITTKEGDYGHYFIAKGNRLYVEEDTELSEEELESLVEKADSILIEKGIEIDYPLPQEVLNLL